MEISSKLSYLIAKIPFFQLISETLNQNHIVYSDNLTGSLKRLLAVYLLNKNYTIFLPHTDSISAKRTKAELDYLGYDENSILFDGQSADFSASSPEEVINAILKKNYIISTTYLALNTPVQSTERFKEQLLILKTGQEIDYDNFITKIENSGYLREKFVEQKGDYALRGSIIDIFSFSNQNPVRIELDGDKISSLRLFDIYNQRSFNLIDEYSIYLGNQDSIINEFSFIYENSKNSVVLLDEYEIKDFKIEISNNCKFIICKALDLDKKAPVQIHSNSKHLPSINSNLKVLENQIKSLIDNEYQINIYAEQESHFQRIRDLLIEYSEFIEDKYDEGIIKFDVFPLQEGFILSDQKLAIFTEHEIFNRPFSVRIKNKKSSKSTFKKFISTINKGDFVVHSDYGIGRFLGLEKIKINEYPQEVLKIEYLNNDIVYVNINYLNKVKKYSATENAKPTLSKLGSSEWKATKAKIKNKIADSVKELIKLYSERKASLGYQFSKDTVWQKELESSFYYEDTPDQIKVTNEIKRDMESPNPMDRLVCGDVGFGKTEVAVRAAFKAVMDSKQVAILVPTTILAEQHYNTFLDRLGKYPITIKVLSRFIKKSEQNKIIKDLSEGKVDILIGTHRILSKDIKFKDIGLLIIDEEHRFGVMAKEKIRQIKANIDTLYLTATPIPRTLNMALAGSKDVSIIATPPPNRLPIITEISMFDIQKIRSVILDEMGRGGQVFFVYDRVKSIDKMANYIKTNVPEARICVAHGQMPSNSLEKVLHDFLQKKFDVLVCTKIIESGLDIPNANTIIINRADRFGLAELYQLRGRVGRTNKQAYAYLFVPSLKSLTKSALQRLQAFEEFSEIGSGFSLSMRDLEIRGAGNLLGTEQSGFINSVGFDMYLKILEETVTEIKETEFKEIFKDKLAQSKFISDTSIDIYYDYNIPDYYIESADERLEIYTRLFNCSDLPEIDDIEYELIDKYGAPPLNVKILFDMAKLKLLGSIAGFEKIEISQKATVLSFPKDGNSFYYDNYFQPILEYINNNILQDFVFSEQKGSLKLKINNNNRSYFETSENLKSLLKKIGMIINSVNLSKKSDQ